MRKIAEKIINEDMGTKKQLSYIAECYERSNKACTLEQFTNAITQEIMDLLGVIDN